MNIENLSQLKKLIAIMRKTGVESFKNSDFEIKLRPEAPLTKKQLKETNEEIKSASSYTEEDLLFWSSTPPDMKEVANG